MTNGFGLSDEGVFSQLRFRGLPIQQRVVLRRLFAVDLGAGDAVYFSLPSLEFDGHAFGTSGGEHLVALEQVLRHELGDLVRPLPPRIDHL